MDTPDEWWLRVEDKRAVAALMKESRDHAVEAWDACGIAVEFALKAYILKRERWNRWPDRSEKPSLYTHDLILLMREAGIARDDVPPTLRTSLRTVLSWTREHAYQAERVPRKQARQMFESTFGVGGVIEWLKSL